MRGINIKKLLDNMETLPKEMDGTFYGSNCGQIYIKTKNGDTPVLDIRGWGYLTGAGGLNLSNEEACKIQDSFERWVINTLNSHREYERKVDKLEGIVDKLLREDNKGE